MLKTLELTNLHDFSALSLVSNFATMVSTYTKGSLVATFHCKLSPLSPHLYQASGLSSNPTTLAHPTFSTLSSTSPAWTRHWPSNPSLTASSPSSSLPGLSLTLVFFFYTRFSIATVVMKLLKKIKIFVKFSRNYYNFVKRCQLEAPLVYHPADTLPHGDVPPHLGLPPCHHGLLLYVPRPAVPLSPG